MSAENVYITVSDPDLLIAGNSPYAPFLATKIQLYRWTSEALARAGSVLSGTLVTTFTIAPSTDEITDIAGPWRYGVYDASQGEGSWYRYRFADAPASNVSLLSEPWQADNRDQLTLRDLIYEVGDLLGQSVLRGTASAGSTLAVTCTPLFKSTARSALLYEGWWLLVSQDAGGASAAPEGEEAIIDSVAIGTGVATLERDLSAAVATNDVFLLSSLLQPSEIVRCINRAREGMRILTTVDIALTDQDDRYPAPSGVRNVTDILDAQGIIQYGNTNREDVYPIGLDVEFDGIRGWIVLTDSPGRTPIARIKYERSYRDLEGNLSLMSDTTSAPLEWIRAAAAFVCADFLVSEDPNEPRFGQLRADMERLASIASGRYAPKIQRRLKATRRILPGPVTV